MAKAIKEVFEDALKLDGPDRARLAAELIASLDGQPDPDAEEAWVMEIQRRVAEVEAGNVELIPWEEVRRRIKEDISGR